MRVGRIIVGGFLLELLLILVLVPPLQLIGPDRVIPWIGPAVAILSFGFAWWFLHKVSYRPVLHGALIGILATAIYILLCFANPDGIGAVVAMYGLFGFIVGNALRISECMVVGYIVSRLTL